MNIGIALDNSLNERWNKEIFFIKKKVQDEGGVVSFRTAFGLPNSQFENVRDMIANDKIDVLILVPVDAIYAKVIVDYAYEHRVKVIAYSRPIEHEKVDFHIKFDVPAIGRQQGQYALDKKKKGNYLIIQGTALNTYAQKYYKLQNTPVHIGNINM